MRNASQLCRGLAEAARSLERPYIPRHDPLPSSSYSRAAPTPPPSSSSVRAANEQASELAEVRKNVSFRPSKQIDSVSPSLVQQQIVSSAPATDTPSIRRGQEDRAPLTAQLSGIERSRSIYPANGNDRHHSSSRSTGAYPPSIPSKGKEAQLRSGRFASNPANSHSFNSGPSTVPSFHGDVKAAYPTLTDAQARLLLRIFSQAQSLRSHPPSALMSWYEDHVWTVERQSEGSDRIETQQSISMLLRYAYQRNDLRSLLRIESRAARVGSPVAPSSAPSPSSVQISKLPEIAPAAGVKLWPGSDENPRMLALNLKVAFAAKHGNWIKVEELLDQADLISTTSSKLYQDQQSVPSSRSGSALSAIGWGGLLQFGLGNVQKLDHGRLSNAACADTSPNTSAEERRLGVDGSITSEWDIALSENRDDQIRKAREHAQQMQAKLSVTKRLLPNLLRFIGGSTNEEQEPRIISRDGAKRSLAPGEPSTPAWLLQSVVAQLAERGETAPTIRIVQLALSETSGAQQHDVAAQNTGTHMLNLALQSCVRNDEISLTETLRIFNSLTASQLGKGISGATVLEQPYVLADSLTRIAQSNHAPSPHMHPNEESLVLILKKVRHPLFRASWTRKLVDDFERLFPKTRLSGRSFRMILDRCVAPAAASWDVGTQTDTAEVAVGERVVTGGKRGGGKQPKQTQSARSSIAPKRRGPKAKLSILLEVLQTILTRFSTDTSRLHRSTTNRRRFEHTLLRTKRILLTKKHTHLQILNPNNTENTPKTTHETKAIVQINNVLTHIAAVLRLGRKKSNRNHH